jgi:ribonuclease D
LQAALAAQGRADWVEQECATWSDPKLYRTDPAEAWRRLKGLGRMQHAEQAAARALAEWRERRAIESDRPRGWILADESLYAIAWRNPQTAAELAGLPGLPDGVVRKRGEEIVALVASARARAGEVAPVVAPRKPTADENALAGRLIELVRGEATALGIAPEVLATRRDVEALAFGSVGLDDSPLARGWRGEVLREKLHAALPARA